MFKFPRFQSPAFARTPPEVNGFSWSLTHPLESKNRLGSGRYSVTVVREPACQSGRQPVIQSPCQFWLLWHFSEVGQPVSQYSQTAVLKMWSKWTTQTVILLFGWMVAISTRRMFTQIARCQSIQSVCKQGSLSLMWLIKLPVTQPHTVVMRGQRIIFLFSFNHPLTLYSSIQSVSLAVMPGGRQASHPGKRSLWSVSQSGSEPEMW